MADRFEDIRGIFPVLENYVYLNNAAVAPLAPFHNFRSQGHYRWLFLFRR